MSEFPDVSLPEAFDTISSPAANAAVSRAAPRRSGWLKWFVRSGTLLVLAALVFFALRNAPLSEIWTAISRLQACQVGLLLVVDATIYALITARWWFVVQAETRSAGYLPLIAVRVSVFAVSYFTFGPQIGGEPLQVLYLRRKYGLSYPRATATVLMDKLFELLGNFVLLIFGLIAIFLSGFLGTATDISRFALFLLAIVVCWPLAHIVLLYRHVYPIAVLLRAVTRGHTPSKTVRFIRASERLAGQFCQRHPKAMLAGMVVSLLAAAVTVSEYALVASFLHIGLPFWQLVTAWTSGWLSFLAPVPGGLGALEASQVFVLGFFGVSAASAISVALILRGRDLVIGGVGLVLAGRAARRR